MPQIHSAPGPRPSALLLTFLLAAFAALLSPATAAEARADDWAWIRVQGSQFVTSPASDGGVRPFLPVGIGYCRDVIIRAQDAEVMKFCKERSLNTVRLSIYTRFFNNKADRPIDIDEHIRTFIDPVVQAAKKAGLYVILDGHEYLSAEINEETAREKQKARLWNDTEIAEWAAAWRRIAEHYKDEPFVLGYEIMNEPHDIAPADVNRILTRGLRAIREVDQRHIVFLSNHAWSHARGMEATWGASASTVDAPYNNVAFTFHEYPEDNHPWDVAKKVLAFRDTHGVPVICTEFGATQWNKSETVCRKFQAGMLALFAKEDIGWMVWALKTLTDNPRAPYNQVDKTGLGPPPVHDSCQYSDLWAPVARIMASPMPKEAK
jgi:hypothetical protein